ncbi:hypothetical protein C8R45DRAFT_1193790 [Mycena sanguinolenta]|nr:hypothetical protein C8R45DRAFT_1193790 [Mycena sanguinolenta]
MSYSSASLPSGLDIAELFVGRWYLLGYLLNWGLFGTLALQLYLYYQAFPNDVLFNKCLVYTICAIEFVQTMLMTHDAFSTFGYGFGDLTALTSLGLEWLALPIMSGLVSLIGQSFYAYRVYILSKSRRTPAFIFAVALISSIGAFVHGSDSHYGKFSNGAMKSGSILINYAQSTPSPSGLTRRYTDLQAQVWLIGSALSDITSTTCLAYYLSKNNIGFRSTRAWFHRLIRLTIQTGSLTAFMALVHLTLFFAFPSKPYFFTAAAVQSKLYANTVLGVLNSRLQIVGGRGHTASSSAGIQVMMSEQRGEGGSGRSPVHTEAFSAKDLDDLVKRTV